jgi:hypothetical protein
MQKIKERLIGGHYDEKFYSSWKKYVKQHNESQKFRKVTEKELIGEALSLLMETRPVK